MSTPAPPDRPPAPYASSGIAVAGVLIGLGAVLAVVAIAYLVLVLSGHQNSTVVCGNSDTSVGECLLSSQVSRAEVHQAWAVSISLAAGAVTAVLAAAASLLLLRRR